MSSNISETTVVSAPPADDFVMSVTEAAVNKVKDFAAKMPDASGKALRVFIQGGGCSGMQYGMAIEKEAGEFDTTIEANGVRVFIDPTSMMYLGGATIDYVDSLMGGGFRIDNPNAVSTCGCGHSFQAGGEGEGGHQH